MNLYIPSVDAKDLYLSNHAVKHVPPGYSLIHEDKTAKLHKYTNSFDYSLDLIELRNVSKKRYGRQDSFSFTSGGKEYSSKIINVTFKYAVKEFNQVAKNTYVRTGYHLADYSLIDGYATDQNEDGVTLLVALKVNEPCHTLFCL